MPVYTILTNAQLADLARTAPQTKTTLGAIEDSTRRLSARIAHGHATASVASPHDRLFHRTFADPANAAALFRLALPPELVEAIDWKTLAELSCQIIDSKLKKHFPDHVYSVRLQDHDLILLVVPEHKSRRASGYVLQELGYVWIVLQKWAEQHSAWKGLPPVIPVLFHHGNKPWRTPTSLRHHFDRAGLGAVRKKEPSLAAVIESVSVSMPSSVVDMAKTDEEWLRRAALPDVCKLVLLCLQVVRFQDEAEGTATLERWRDLIVAVHNAPLGQGKLEGIDSYLLKITNLGLEPLYEIVQRATGTGDELMSTAERLRKEGKAEGKAEGRTQHAVETVLRLLTRRFGEPAESVAARVRGASLVELDLWTDRILDAKTLDDVFAAK